MTTQVLTKDYKVADISLADWGRKEIASPKVKCLR
jgi:S-adenosylhomocysteine hydrolase